MTFPTPEQQVYLDASLDDHVYLGACPGSGKTAVIAAMIAKATEQWTRFPSGIAVLTFCNSATDELKGRLIERLGEPLGHPHWVSTFDSFLLNYLVANIASKLTEYPGRDGDFRIRLLDKTANIFQTRTKFGERRISACKYDYDLDSKRFIFTTGERSDAPLNAAKLSGDQKADLIDTKRRLWRAGFATYRDVDMLALKALKDPEFDEYFAKVVRRFPLTIVDECQDLSAEHLAIIRHMANRGMKFHFVGDLNQSIYGFRKSDPVRVHKLLQDLKFIDYELTANWRSGQAIVDLCADLVNVPRSVGNQKIQLLKPLLIQYQRCPSELTPQISELTQDYKNVVVVARGHGTLQRLTCGAALTSVEELALACLSIKSDNLDDIRHALKSFSGWLSNRLSLEVSTGSLSCPIQVESKVEWRQFIYNCLKFLSDSGAGNIDLTWKQWAAMTKRFIQEIPDQPFVPENVVQLLAELRVVNLSAPKGLGATPLSDRLLYGCRHPTSNLKYATIHQVKGETHDATVVISSLKAGTQGNWKDWLKDPKSEAARFAYVASSRPRELLIWGVKTLKPAESQRMRELGFELR